MWLKARRNRWACPGEAKRFITRSRVLVGQWEFSAHHPLLVACGRPARRRARHPGAVTPKRGGGQAVFPQTAQEPAIRAAGDRHRQAGQLSGRSPRAGAVGDPSPLQVPQPGAPICRARLGLPARYPKLLRVGVTQSQSTRRDALARKLIDRCVGAVSVRSRLPIAAMTGNPSIFQRSASHVGWGSTPDGLAWSQFTSSRRGHFELTLRGIVAVRSSPVSVVSMRHREPSSARRCVTPREMVTVVQSRSKSLQRNVETSPKRNPHQPVNRPGESGDSSGTSRAIQTDGDAQRKHLSFAAGQCGPRSGPPQQLHLYPDCSEVVGIQGIRDGRWTARNAARRVVQPRLRPQRRSHGHNTA
jgi:hypothetical protein